MTDILMPSLSDQMSEGTIITWLVADGATVSTGDEICEIETDKATMGFAAEAGGVLAIVAAAGTTVAVGDPIARLDDPGAASTISSPERAESAPSEPTAQAPAAQEPTPSGGGTPADHPLATPVARRTATAHDVDLAALTGSGPAGRITKGDVLRAAGIESTSEPETPARPLESSAGAGGTEIREPTHLQRTIARRMTEQAAVPVFGVQTDVEMDAALALRAELKAIADAGRAPSVNDVILRASALALREHPLVNGSFQDGRFVLHRGIHVGMAVTSEDGLVVATIRDADRRSLADLARESRRLSEAVRGGGATVGDLTGATFTVSNLGMYGMTQIYPVINPPQAAILGVGAARPTLSRTPEGEIVEASLLTLTLVCDHRILSGADGSRYLAEVKALLEAPLRLLV